MRWFRDFDSNVAFDGDKAMTADFSLQLSKSIANFIEYKSQSEQPSFGILTFGVFRNGITADIAGYCAVLWHDIQLEFGLSAGPLSRLFQPRCCTGKLASVLICVLFRFLFIIVLFGVGFEWLNVTLGSFPYIKPTGCKFSHGFLLFSFPL
jgi:hypothetical protein